MVCGKMDCVQLESFDVLRDEHQQGIYTLGCRHRLASGSLFPILEQEDSPRCPLCRSVIKQVTAEATGLETHVSKFFYTECCRSQARYTMTLEFVRTRQNAAVTPEFSYVCLHRMHVGEMDDLLQCSLRILKEKHIAPSSLIMHSVAHGVRVSVNFLLVSTGDLAISVWHTKDDDFQTRLSIVKGDLLCLPGVVPRRNALIARRGVSFGWEAEPGNQYAFEVGGPAVVVRGILRIIHGPHLVYKLKISFVQSPGCTREPEMWIPPSLDYI